MHLYLTASARDNGSVQTSLYPEPWPWAPPRDGHDRRTYTHDNSKAVGTAGRTGLDTRQAGVGDPDTWAEKFESFERINSIRETNGNFDSCNSCKRLGTSRLHELHESKFPFVSRIEFIRSKLSNFSAHVSGVTESPRLAGQDGQVGTAGQSMRGQCVEYMYSRTRHRNMTWYCYDRSILNWWPEVKSVVMMWMTV